MTEVAKWVLVLIVQNGAGNATHQYGSKEKMTLKECEAAISTFRAKSPTGGDAEVSIAVIYSPGGLGNAK